MSNGDSPDGFLFPPFIPPARRAEAPAAPPPAPSAEAPPAAPQSGAAARPTMPWDAETPIVRDEPAAPHAAADAGDEDLPWLERPEPRAAQSAAPAPEAPAAPARDDAFPDWLAWDDRATDDARGEVSGTAPLEGLEDFAPAESFGHAAEPETGTPDPADASFWSLDAPEAAEPPPVADAATPSPALGTPDPADPAFWSLDAPEAAEPPPVADASAEPAFDVTLEGDAITFAPAAAGSGVEVEPDNPLAFLSGPATDVREEEALDEQAEEEAGVAAPAEDRAPAAQPAASGAFAEVAARLEDIARTLRERPDDLLSGAASDPLALLVAGYVMGYNARR